MKAQAMLWLGTSTLGLLGSTAAAAQALPTPAPAPVPSPQVQASPQAEAATPAAPATGAASGPEAEIVVTGSRVATSGYSAPTPTQVVSAENLQQRGLTSIGDFLAEIPAFRGSSTSQTNTQNSAGFGQNFADLRGLGSIRTLTLVDGRRHVPTSSTGQVDLNLIPTALISRVDVVTGGASAVYGSDAVSGVVNVILNRRLQGITGDVSYGITQRGDNRERRASLAAGTAFNDGRGRIVIGGDYVRSSGVDSYLERDWGRELPSLVTYTGARAANQPSRFWARGVTFNNQAYGGLILGSNADTNAANGVDALRGIAFGPGGAIVPFNYGQTVGVNAINFSGGDANLNSYSDIKAVVPLTRHVVMAHVEHEIADDITVFVQGSEGRSGVVITSPSDHNTTIPIRRDNAYLPADVAARMDANGITGFTLGRYFSDAYVPSPHNSSQTLRFVGGIEGKIGGGWSFDGYYEYGRNTYESRIVDQRINRNFSLAADAIRDPATGQPVCRDVAARAAGCVPVNLFGVGSVSDAAKAYFLGTTFGQVRTTQEVVALNVKGTLFSTWAGPVGVAFGGEYRREAARGISDAISRAGGYYYGNTNAFSGSYNVKDIYLEAELPLARDLPFAQTLDLNGAVRHSDYSSSGGATTWKGGVTYAPIADIRFRAVRSRDIRAPNNSELFASTTSVALLRNPFNGIAAATTVVNAPNASLAPEKADTFTVGAVFNPRFARRFTASVDYFDIRVKGAIASFDAATILDNCANEVRAGAPGFSCGYVNATGFTATSVLNGVTQQLLNLASVKSRGIDFNASYTLPIGASTLVAQVAASRALDLTTNDGIGRAVTLDPTGTYIVNRGSVIDRAGQVGGFTAGGNNGATGAPKWIVNTSLTLRTDRLTATVEGRYIDGGHLDNTLIGPDESGYSPLSPISIGDNVVNGRFYVNMSAQYDVVADGRRKLSFYGVVSNLTDADPPFPATAFSGLYDRLGRNFKMGLRFAY